MNASNLASDYKPEWLNLFITSNSVTGNRFDEIQQLNPHRNLPYPSNKQEITFILFLSKQLNFLIETFKICLNISLLSASYKLVAAFSQSPKSTILRFHLPSINKVCVLISIINVFALWTFLLIISIGIIFRLAKRFYCFVGNWKQF